MCYVISFPRSIFMTALLCVGLPWAASCSFRCFSIRDPRTRDSWRSSPSHPPSLISGVKLSGTKRTSVSLRTEEGLRTPDQAMNPKVPALSKKCQKQRKANDCCTPASVDIILHFSLCKKVPTSGLPSLAKHLKSLLNSNSAVRSFCSSSIPSPLWTCNAVQYLRPKHIFEWKALQSHWFSDWCCFTIDLTISQSYCSKSKGASNQTMADFSASPFWIAFCSSVASIEPGSNMPLHAPSP